jgi:ABC-type transporter Mla subunit MlaD
LARSNGSNENDRLIELFVRALQDHEKEMDRLIGKLKALKTELSTGVEAANVGIEKLNPKLDNLQSQLVRLKRFVELKY